ncbi:Oidioi.mRNA.OKI2018_I69.chr1.g3556.t1.cds [Oikopleura dioica]|uniref:Oidioi.mRNA.OKI2018_I69.chr1.g3556.t1.cds n=1 Tax=Oikopleura dioica TaxID=34765 RepID=A0ABN7T3N0_OIKDI|nr:Oidioi.mRNA.OKI2018_I69.chr1.g3556.t1.cds [Oikopleura dioica]
MTNTDADLQSMFPDIPSWKFQQRKLVCAANIAEHKDNLAILYCKIWDIARGGESIVVTDGEETIKVTGKNELLEEFKFGDYIKIEGRVETDSGSQGVKLEAYEIEETPDASDESLKLANGTALQADKWSAVIYGN